MASKNETALNALKTLVATVSGPTVQRNGIVPGDIPAGGLIVVRDGEVGEPESVTLSPRTYHYEHRAELEFFVKLGTAALRDALLDSLRVSVSAAITANRTLTAAVDYCMAEAPVQPDEEAMEGTDDVKRCLVPVTLMYSTTDPLN